MMDTKQTRVLGFVPAKGASTRLKRKNIIPFGGTSLLALAVHSLIDSKLCEQVIVSTEDEEIARAGIEAGAIVPFLRPERLAVDPAGIVDVALYTLERLEEQGEVFDELIIASPTCPLRISHDVGEAYELFKREKAKRLMSVVEYDHSPYSAWTLSESDEALPLFPEHCNKKSQELDKAYRCNGAIHILDIPEFRRCRSYTAAPIVAYRMPPERSVDVDTGLDFAFAEYLYNKRA